MGVKHKLLNKSGAWYSYNDEKIGQGRTNAMKWLAEHPDVAVELERKLREELLSNPEQLLVADDTEKQPEDDALNFGE